jgi:hypothetical protein
MCFFIGHLLMHFEKLPSEEQRACQVPQNKIE